MKANNNPVLLREKKISLEIEEKKENALINLYAKKQIRYLIKQSKQFKEIHISKSGLTCFN